jgi:hypothetical protein
MQAGSGVSEMSEGSLIPYAIVVFAGVREIPRIIWSLRCAPDSENYQCPYSRYSIGGLVALFSDRRGNSKRESDMPTR